MLLVDGWTRQCQMPPMRDKDALKRRPPSHRWTRRAVQRLKEVWEWVDDIPQGPLRAAISDTLLAHFPASAFPIATRSEAVQSEGQPLHRTTAILRAWEAGVAAAGEGARSIPGVLADAASFEPVELPWNRVYCPVEKIYFFRNADTGETTTHFPQPAEQTSFDEGSKCFLVVSTPL